jgi:ubiquinone/menaquinone biosynthesis C-methylase UbiE
MILTSYLSQRFANAVFSRRYEGGMYDIKINNSMVKLSQKNMAKYDIPATITHGDIEKTDYKDDFFDVVTCSASFSYWKNPIQGLEEVFRILRKGGIGVFYEPYKEIDIEKLKSGIRESLNDKSRIRKFFAIQFNVFGLKYGHKLGLKLYSYDEFQEIIQQTQFKDDYLLEITTAFNSPVFVRISLHKA